jgi:hypothetical protein
MNPILDSSPLSFCREHTPHLSMSQNTQGGMVVPHSIGGPTRESLAMVPDKWDEPSHFESLAFAMASSGELAKCSFSTILINSITSAEG